MKGWKDSLLTLAERTPFSVFATPLCAVNRRENTISNSKLSWKMSLVGKRLPPVIVIFVFLLNLILHGRRLPLFIEDGHKVRTKFNESSLLKGRTIFQTWRESKLPEQIEKYWNSEYLPNNPEYNRVVFDNEQMNAFMETHFSNTKTHQAYTSIHPNLMVMRSDLWRYCVLYIYGGVYIDADSSLVTNLREWPVQDVPILSREGQNFNVYEKHCTKVWKPMGRMFPKSLSVSDNSILQWLLIFPKPGHPILREAIDLVTNLILAWRDEYSQDSSVDERIWCLTGPPVFSVAVNSASNSSFLLDGVDYNGKAIFKANGFGLYSIRNRFTTVYRRKIRTQSIKVAN